MKRRMFLKGVSLLLASRYIPKIPIGPPDGLVLHIPDHIQTIADAMNWDLFAGVRRGGKTMSFWIYNHTDHSINIRPPTSQIIYNDGYTEEV